MLSSSFCDAQFKPFSWNHSIPPHSFLFYHILIFTFSITKSTVARSMVSDVCLVCPLNMFYTTEWITLLCYIKIICFGSEIGSIHQPISCTFQFTNSASTLVISIGIAWAYFIANCFAFLVLQWVLIVSPVQQRCIRWKQCQSCCSFSARLISLLPFFSYWLVSVSENLDNNSRCDIAYRRLFFY